MAQLLLLRHAKSSWDDPALTDHERPLNPRGQRAARAMAGAFASLGLVPELALVSSSRRTRQTLEALGLPADLTEIRITEQLYLADAEAILDLLRALPDRTRSVLVIGHNPGLYDTAMELVGNDPAARPEPPVMRLLDGYPTASLAEFELDQPWHSLPAPPRRLVRFQRPDDFDRSLAGGESDG